MAKSPLQKQLEDQRFLRAVDYVLNSAGGIKKINSGELAHLNQILTDSKDEVWRFGEAKVTIPTGQTHHFNLLGNPLNQARDILGIANQMAGNGEPQKAAFYIYTELVKSHVFKDANRRSAVLATIWILHEAGFKVDAQELQNIPLGDLRDAGDLAKFQTQFNLLVTKN